MMVKEVVEGGEDEYLREGGERRPARRRAAGAASAGSGRGHGWRREGGLAGKKEVFCARGGAWTTMTKGTTFYKNYHLRQQ